MKAVLLLIAALAAAPATAQSAGQWEGPEHIWGASCTYCHDKGVAQQIRGRKLPAAGIAAVVRYGVPGMPAFHPSELNDKDLALLARWIEKSPAPPRAESE